MEKESKEEIQTDLMNIMDVEELDEYILEALERGKTERVQVLIGTESPHRLGEIPKAHTRVKISCGSEEAVRECVKMLKWSDERLRALPEQLLLWSWDVIDREGMDVHFGVNWYDRDFFEKRKNAFLEPRHVEYFQLFGTNPEDFEVQHFIEGDPGYDDEVEHHRIARPIPTRPHPKS